MRLEQMRLAREQMCHVQCAWALSTTTSGSDQLGTASARCVDSQSQRVAVYSRRALLVGGLGGADDPTALDGGADDGTLPELRRGQNRYLHL